MSGIKLLFSSYDCSRFINRNYELFRQEAARQSEVVFWRYKGNVQEILEKIKFKPDFIILDCSPGLSDLDKVNIPKALILDDVHWEIEENKGLIKRGKIDIIFSRTNEAFNKYYSEFKDKFTWLPYGVDTRIFRDYQEEKKINFLLMGAVWPKAYPFRAKVLEKFNGVDGFVYHHHPGYINVDEKQEGVYVGEKYAREINRAKIFFTCDSVNHYPIAKYMEVLACNTLLLAPSNNDLSKLGFKDEINFVECNQENFYEKAMYYLENEHERKRIAYNGYQFVYENHSNRVRVAKFINHLEHFIEK